MYLIKFLANERKVADELKSCSRREFWWVTFFIPDSVTLCETQNFVSILCLSHNVRPFIPILSHHPFSFFSRAMHVFLPSHPISSSPGVHDVTIEPIPYTFARDGGMCATRRRLRKKNIRGLFQA